MAAIVDFTLYDNRSWLQCMLKSIWRRCYATDRKNQLPEDDAVASLSSNNKSLPLSRHDSVQSRLTFKTLQPLRDAELVALIMKVKETTNGRKEMEKFYYPVVDELNLIWSGW